MRRLSEIFPHLYLYVKSDRNEHTAQFCRFNLMNQVRTLTSIVGIIPIACYTFTSFD